MVQAERVFINSLPTRCKTAERHGEGATELDAMEALHPSEMAEIIRETVEEYRDQDFPDRLQETLPARDSPRPPWLRGQATAAGRPLSAL